MTGESEVSYSHWALEDVSCFALTYRYWERPYAPNPRHEASEKGFCRFQPHQRVHTFFDRLIPVIDTPVGLPNMGPIA
eukprot:22574-Pyramimonas_sp.AAC.2